MIKVPLMVSLICFAALPVAAMADDFFGNVETQGADTQNADARWQLSGYFQQSVAYGMASPVAPIPRNQTDLTRLESKVVLNLNWQPIDALKFQLAGELTHGWLSTWPDQLSYTLSDDDADARAWQLNWNDSYVDANLGLAWLRLGYQTVALGESESATLIDVLSPRNNQRPGQTDLDDSRIPVPALKLDMPLGNSQFSAITIYQAGVDLAAAAGAEFDPYLALRPLDVEVNQSAPDSPFEFALLLNTNIGGSDIAILLADVNNNQAHLASAALANNNGVPILVNGQPVIEALNTAQDRYQLLGISANKAMGRWLVRSELAYKHKYITMPSSDDLFSPWPEANHVQAMLGFEVTGFNGFTLSMETNANAKSNSDPLQLGWGTRLAWVGMNDRLNAQIVAVALPDEQLQSSHGLMHSSLNWNLWDGWNAELANTLYFAEHSDQALYPFEQNDSVSVQIRGSF